MRLRATQAETKQAILDYLKRCEGTFHTGENCRYGQQDGPDDFINECECDEEEAYRYMGKVLMKDESLDHFHNLCDWGHIFPLCALIEKEPKNFRFFGIAEDVRVEECSVELFKKNVR